MNVCEDSGCFEIGPGHSLLKLDVLFELDNGEREIFMGEETWFDLIEINLILVGSNKQWNIVLLTLIEFLLVHCYRNAVESFAEEVAGECHFVNEDVIGVTLCEFFQNSCKNHASLDIFCCIFLHRIWFDVIEGVSHFREMSRDDGSRIDLPESPKNVFG